MGYYDTVSAQHTFVHFSVVPDLIRIYVSPPLAGGD